MRTSNLARAIDEPFSEAIAPEPDRFVWQWGEDYRILPSDSPEPGPKSYDRTPYLREPAEALSPQSPFERVVVAKGSQVGMTDLGADWCGHTIHLSPSTMMIIWPSTEFTKRKSRELIDPLIEGTPALRERIAPARSRDSNNTVLVKKFMGGRLVMTGANSGIGMRSTAARRVFLDEIDAFVMETKNEGDPVRLAMRATRNFKGRRKILVTSTPLISGASLIEREFNRCDQAKDYHLPCPRCEFMQPLVWDCMAWTTTGSGDELRVHDVHYRCANCEQPIYNHEKSTMLGAGKWVHRWDRGSNSIGFHLSALYSPVGWYAWEEAAQDYVIAKEHPSELRTWTNTVLGLSHAEQHEAPSWERLYARRESYEIATVPHGALCLTGGVDVQANRIEVSVIGWGRGKENWAVDYYVVPCDPAKRVEFHAVLTDVLKKRYPCAGGGEMGLRVLAIDSGYMPVHIESWARLQRQPAYSPAGQIARFPLTVMVTKGEGKWGRIVRTSTKYELANQKRGCRIWMLATLTAKRELYDFLRLEPPTPTELVEGKPYPAGYCHVPDFREDYFKQLTSARFILKGRPDGTVGATFKKDPSTPDEVLDCWVGARAGAAMVGIERFQDPDWQALERARYGATPPPAPSPDSTPVPPPPVVSTAPVETVPKSGTAVPVSQPVVKRRKTIPNAWMNRYR